MTYEFHKFCKRLPLREDLIDELAENMMAGGWLSSSTVTIFEGEVLDGRHRYLAAGKAGIHPICIKFTGDDDAALRFVFQENFLRRHMTSDEKRAYLKAMRDDGVWVKLETGRPKSNTSGEVISQEKIAELLGVGHSTVQRWDAEDSPLVETKPSVPAKPEPKPRVPAKPENEPNPSAEKEHDPRTYPSIKYTDMVRSVLGDIDLDLISDEFGQDLSEAKEYRLLAESLNSPWVGKVWCYLPLAGDEVEDFAYRIAEESEVGLITGSITLAHSEPTERWFRVLLRACSAFCICSGDTRLVDRDDLSEDERVPSVFVYFGKKTDRFFEVFQDEGIICVPMEG